MANKRIRELDTMTIGSAGTAASSVFLAVDPNSGTTSKVSLEDAVAGTAALSAASGGGGAVGIPSIANQANMRASRNGTPITVANLFATNTTTFGNFSFSGVSGFRGGAALLNSLTLSKSKGTNSLLLTVNSPIEGGSNKALAIGSGSPREGGAYYTVSSSQKGTHVQLQVSFWSNGFYVRSASTISFQLMYWPQ